VAHAEHKGLGRVSGGALAVAALALLTGAVLLLCSGGSAGPGQSGLGLVLLVFGLPLLVAGTFIGVYDPAPADRVRAATRGSMLLLLMTVSLTATLAAVAGLLVRWIDPADTVGRYGTKATVTLQEDACENDTIVHVPSGAKEAAPDVVCSGATWTLHGTTHRGTAILAFEDVYQPDLSYRIPRTVDAYVLGDQVYSARRVGKVENVSAWAGVPLWWLPVGLVVFVVSIVAFAFSGWITREDNEDGATLPANV
jgi:hypothetical protein